MATITTATATVQNEFGEDISEADLVYSPGDRRRMYAELSDIPAFKALLEATSPAA